MPAMPQLRRATRSVARRRQELEQLAIKRWNTLDTLVLRSLGMFLGALFVTIVVSFKPDQMDLADYYSIRLGITLAIVPILLLYITKYSPPTSVQIENGSDTIEFRMVNNVKVSLYMNSNIVMPDIESIEVEPTSKEVRLKDYVDDGADSLEEKSLKPLVIKIDSKTWPKKELSHALAMLSSVNEGEFTSCAQDTQVLTTKVVLQVLCWTIRDFIANSLFHEWNVSAAQDFAFALVMFVIFWVLTWVTNLFAMKPYATYHNPPFFSVKEKWQTSLRRIAATYLEVILACLPLSVGYSFNQVCRDLHMDVMSRAEVQMTDASRSDYYGSVVLFSYAVYFLILTVLTVALRVYAKSVFTYIFQHKLLRNLVDFIDTKFCCNVCREKLAEDKPPASSEKATEAPAAPAAPAEAASEPIEEQSGKESGKEQAISQRSAEPPVPQQHAAAATEPLPQGKQDETGSMFPRLTQRQVPSEKPAVREPSAPPNDERGAPPGASDMLCTVAVLRDKVRRLERAVGISGPPPNRHDDEGVLPAILNKHWKQVTVVTADQVSIKTLQFLFAWATLYLVEHFFFVFIVECKRSNSDPWTTPCTYQSTLALSLFLSVTSFVYLYTIAGLRKQTAAHEAFFDLQTQAIPLTVGWTWKGFADDIMEKLSVEWAGGKMVPVYITLFVTMYIFGILVMHTYSIISRDMRAKYASLELQ